MNALTGAKVTNKHNKRQSPVVGGWPLRPHRPEAGGPQPAAPGVRGEDRTAPSPCLFITAGPRLEPCALAYVKDY